MKVLIILIKQFDELPKKIFGSKFLTDKNIVKKILNLANFRDKDVIEIGPGKGALTEEILKRNPKSLLLIEKDNNLSSLLVSRFSSYRFINIINSDILKFDFENLKKKNILFLEICLIIFHHKF